MWEVHQQKLVSRNGDFLRKCVSRGGNELCGDGDGDGGGDNDDDDDGDDGDSDSDSDSDDE